MGDAGAGESPAAQAIQRLTVHRDISRRSNEEQARQLKGENDKKILRALRIRYHNRQYQALTTDHHDRGRKMTESSLHESRKVPFSRVLQAFVARLKTTSIHAVASRSPSPKRTPASWSQQLTPRGGGMDQWDVEASLGARIGPHLDTALEFLPEEHCRKLVLVCRELCRALHDRLAAYHSSLEFTLRRQWVDAVRELQIIPEAFFESFLVQESGEKSPVGERHEALCTPTVPDAPSGPRSPQQETEPLLELVADTNHAQLLEGSARFSATFNSQRSQPRGWTESDTEDTPESDLGNTLTDHRDGLSLASGMMPKAVQLMLAPLAALLEKDSELLYLSPDVSRPLLVGCFIAGKLKPGVLASIDPDSGLDLPVARAIYAFLVKAHEPFDTVAEWIEHTKLVNASAGAVLQWLFCLVRCRLIDQQ
jgi:hypothetical protein